MTTLIYHNQCDILDNEKGFFIMEHLPSGRLHPGKSLNMQNEIEGIILQLEERRYRSRILQTLHNQSAYYRIIKHPVSRIDEAKSHYRAFLASNRRDLYFVVL